LVEGVSNVTAKVFKRNKKVFGESLKKMFLAMANDIRVVIIKLADRLHNMRTIQYLPEEKQKIIAQETIDIYAPLAHRLGMERIKSELEDISFSILYPEQYRFVANYIREKKISREKKIQDLKNKIQNELTKNGIQAEITGRPKHFYSIYIKMIKENKQINDIYDLIALRIITQTVNDCYSCLGIIHNMWKPLPNRIKDYIAMPKSNMYQSLHTTVIDDDGKPVEIQIRTKEMDDVAEEGIAAHWNYKEEKQFDKKMDNTFIWLRQMLEWQSNIKGNDQFLNELKIDLFQEEVFVFTPKGEVKELIKGSTIIDFAYSVHSELGDHCIGAKVNGKWVTIKYELNNGDIVEILKSSTQHPTIDWLKIAKTAKAKNRIRHWLRTNQDIRENIEKGTQLLTEALDNYELKMGDISEEQWNKIKQYYNINSTDDILAGIGYGEFQAQRIANNVYKDLVERKKIVKFQKTGKEKKKNEIIIDEKYSDIDYKIAKCCNPVPGDEIIGIYTKKGISIHRSGCENIKLDKIMFPLVKADWSGEIRDFYLAKIRILTDNKGDVASGVTNAITNAKAYLNFLNITEKKNDRLIIEIFVKIKDQQHLSDVISAIKKVSGVIEVEREKT
ncbi:MAG: bifunctional (p)ppGpp synthetase/guanosine-3',5'-bis(diphosphate) 3'-pyrophosphohydrolase, partial [Candidatus Goldbacteria bacterium]|nr:bifunctional (p)ppGpp synthetase/guanosine-3',5'-bis(diphosphate) 3'-pyrophosphohydrolase [Candidatus Goldiibacteriota bacterium]